MSCPLYCVCTQDKGHDINRPFLLINPLSVSIEKVIEGFSTIVCNSMIILNKQRQELNNLVTIQRVKLEGAHKRSKSLEFVIL